MPLLAHERQGFPFEQRCFAFEHEKHACGFLPGRLGDEGFAELKS